MEAGAVISGRGRRRWRSVSEKRQIVELTLVAGASVAEVAREHSVNANQVFKWRREFRRGELMQPPPALLPVSITLSDPPAEQSQQGREPLSSQGSINIELPGGVLINVESGADVVLLRQVLECLQR